MYFPIHSIVYIQSAFLHVSFRAFHLLLIFLSVSAFWITAAQDWVKSFRRKALNRLPRVVIFLQGSGEGSMRLCELLNSPPRLLFIYLFMHSLFIYAYHFFFLLIQALFYLFIYLVRFIMWHLPLNFFSFFHPIVLYFFPFLCWFRSFWVFFITRKQFKGKQKETVMKQKKPATHGLNIFPDFFFFFTLNINFLGLI